MIDIEIRWLRRIKACSAQNARTTSTTRNSQEFPGTEQMPLSTIYTRELDRLVIVRLLCTYSLVKCYGALEHTPRRTNSRAIMDSKKNENDKEKCDGPTFLPEKSKRATNLLVTIASVNAIMCDCYTQIVSTVPPWRNGEGNWRAFSIWEPCHMSRCVTR